ncbi:MAG: hypothetical protein ACT4PO_12120 [Actinomycetota bacterium]
MTTGGDSALLPEAIVQEAIDLYEAAAGRSILLRLIGSLAIGMRCERHGSLLATLGRRPVRDIDFIAYSKQQKGIEALFESRGYAIDPNVRHSQEFGIKRLIYHHPRDWVKVDVFMDELVMAHTIDFKGRLELDAPTVTLTDLLLSKLQIHEITENDLMDVTVLLTEHGLGAGENGLIDLPYLAGIMGRDWGFYTSTVGNLDRLGEALVRYAALPYDVRERVGARSRAIRDAIEAEPKTRKWRLRARVGTRMRWYEEVGEVER